MENKKKERIELILSVTALLLSGLCGYIIWQKLEWGLFAGLAGALICFAILALILTKIPKAVFHVALYENEDNKDEKEDVKDEDIRRFISEMMSENVNVRDQAFAALKKAGDTAVQPLIKTLEHEDLKFRRQAAEALGMINTQACIQALLNVLSDPRYEMFSRVNYVLWLIGEPAVSPLVKKLQDDVPEVRRRAVIALGQMIHRRKADPSVSIWLDPSSIYTLDSIRGDIDVERVRSEMKDPLNKLLQDEDKSVRESAAEVLGEMGDPGAVELLIPAFKGEKGFGDPQMKAKSALEKIGEPAVEPLIQVLKDEYKGVRKDAVEVLGKIGDARAVEPLIQALKDEDEGFRTAAKQALEKIKAKKS
jgi:HEAT repeat protein